MRWCRIRIPKQQSLDLIPPDPVSAAGKTCYALQHVCSCFHHCIMHQHQRTSEAVRSLLFVEKAWSAQPPCLPWTASSTQTEK